MPDDIVTSARFSVPKSPKRQIFQIKNFLGCDCTSSPSAVDENHSPDCVNMVRYMPGKIRKRMGYNYAASGTDTIYDIWKWDNDTYFVHCGVKLFLISRNTTNEFDWSVLSTGVDTTYSYRLRKCVSEHPEAYQTLELARKKYVYNRANNEAIIIGNGDLYFIKNKKVFPPEAYNVYVPTVTIGKSPDGSGGMSYEAFNLLKPSFVESFYVSSEDEPEPPEYLTLNLSYENLRAIYKVEALDDDGEWLTVNSSSYSVNTVNGTVTFTDGASYVSPIEGEDNIRVYATLNASEYNASGVSNKINNCSISIAYGVNGSNNRLFVSGNPDYPNYDWYSEMDDITYFPDINYSVLGSDASPIKGYAIVSNMLVTLKGEGTDPQTAIIRTGTLDNDGNAIFTIAKSLQGSAIVSSDSVAVAGTEPMFLTNEGIMAITQTDITGGEILNLRSFYINGKLLKESHLDKAEAIKKGDFYMLFLGNHVYILDTLQAITTANTPYSSRQYASFYWEMYEAMSLPTVIDNIIYAVTANGLVKFYDNENNLASYNDNNHAIYCRYDTADFDEVIFFKNKTYRYFAMRAFPSVASSVNVYVSRNGEWELLKDDGATIRYFTFSQLVFSKFTFRTDKGTRLVNTKARIKKMDHVRFRVENGELNEPFMIDQIGVEFTQSGNYKN